MLCITNACAKTKTWHSVFVCGGEGGCDWDKASVHLRNDTLSRTSAEAVVFEIDELATGSNCDESVVRSDLFGSSDESRETAAVAAATEASIDGPAEYDEKNVSAFIS